MSEHQDRRGGGELRNRGPHLDVRRGDVICVDGVLYWSQPGHWACSLHPVALQQGDYLVERGK